MSPRPTVLAALNTALHTMMAEDERVLVMGEDLLDPYGGAFKVTRGLSEAYGDRVLTTPISEPGFVGVATGAAMRGLRPVVEIMFGDFIALAADQLLNHATKYPWMYDGQVAMPLVVRTPMGGRRGYGPTHSQTLDKHLLGIPGLVVVAVSPFVDPGRLLRTAVDDPRPVVFVENKSMYPRRLRLADARGRTGELFSSTTDDPYPTATLAFDSTAPADVTVVAYGGMAELAAEAAERCLIDDEILCEVVVPHALNPLDLAPIRASLSRSGRLVVCEESTRTAGFGAEVLARIASEAFGSLRAPPVRVAALDTPIANSPTLEAAILPQLDDVVRAIQGLAC